MGLTYIVTGHMRTGTSMLMDCGRGGGLTPLYREDREEFRKSYASKKYDPNKGGLYEIGLCPPCREVQRMAKFGVTRGYQKLLADIRKDCEGFPCMSHFRETPEPYSGHLMKVLVNKSGTLLQEILPLALNYSIVMMRRNPEEIRQSYEGFFLGSKAPPLVQDPDWYYAHFNRVKNKCPWPVLDLWFRDVVEKPIESMIKIRDFGWPIDVEKAALIVDQDQCRYRIENLDLSV